MRSSFYVIAILLILAGCVTPAASNAPTNMTNSTAVVAPKNVTAAPLANESHSFTAPVDGTPLSSAPSKPFTIPNGTKELNLTVRFSPARAGPAPARTPAALASGISVKLGSLECALPDGPVVGTVACTKLGNATPGEAHLDYAGEGDVSARVVVTAT